MISEHVHVVMYNMKTLMNCGNTKLPNSTLAILTINKYHVIFAPKPFIIPSTFNVTRLNNMQKSVELK